VGDAGGLLPNRRRGNAPSNGARLQLPNAQFTASSRQVVLRREGFGFALPDDYSADLFIHRTIVAAGGVTALKAGERIDLLPVRTVAKREPR
jgi:cold shock CspA family protein